MSPGIRTGWPLCLYKAEAPDASRGTPEWPLSVDDHLHLASVHGVRLMFGNVVAHVVEEPEFNSRGEVPGPLPTLLWPNASVFGGL